METFIALASLILKALELLERRYDAKATKKALHGKHARKPR